MSDDEWIDFSFRHADEGHLVCSLDDAKAHIAAGALTAETRITAFLPEGRKAMKAGDLPQLPFSHPKDALASSRNMKGARGATIPTVATKGEQAPIAVFHHSSPRDETRKDNPDASTTAPWAQAGEGDAGIGSEEAVGHVNGAHSDNPPNTVGRLGTIPEPIEPTSEDESRSVPPTKPASKFWRNYFLMMIALVGLVMLFGQEEVAEEVSVVVTGTANVRDRPTSIGSRVLFSYERGEELSGRWVPGEIEATQQWLEIEVDGELRYVWSGNLEERATAVSLNESEPSAAVPNIPPQEASEPPPDLQADTAPPLQRYVGSYPFDGVDGVSFWQHPAVLAAVEAYAPSRSIRGMILDGNGVTAPIEQLPDGWIVGRACEPHNCSGQNWAVIVSPDGTNGVVCYFNDAAVAPSSGFYGANGYIKFPNENNGRGCF